MTDAQLAQGFTITWGGSPIAEVTNFDFPSTVDEVDVTNHDSAGRAREFIAGLFSGQEITFTVNYVAADHGSIVDAAGDSTAVDTLAITLPDASDDFEVDAWVKGYTIHAPATGEALTADLVFKTTGPVTHGGS